jgi:hypothetical protein
MSRFRSLASVLVLSALVVSCSDQTTAPSVPADGPQMSAVSDGLSPLEHSLLDALAAGEDPGAIINRDVGCGLTTGFGVVNDDGTVTPVGFGGLFPQPGPNGICPLSSFERTNPDGTVDSHTQGRGAFFLVLFGLGFYPSTGSDVIWRDISHEGGTSVFTVSGTLSDGSKVRAHFVRDPKGNIKEANALWVEGLGYVVGGPPGRR